MPPPFWDYLREYDELRDEMDGESDFDRAGKFIAHLERKLIAAAAGLGLHGADRSRHQ